MVPAEGPSFLRISTAAMTLMPSSAGDGAMSGIFGAAMRSREPRQPGEAVDFLTAVGAWPR